MHARALAGFHCILRASTPVVRKLPRPCCVCVCVCMSVCGWVDADARVRPPDARVASLRVRESEQRHGTAPSRLPPQHADTTSPPAVLLTPVPDHAWRGPAGTSKSARSCRRRRRTPMAERVRSSDEARAAIGREIQLACAGPGPHTHDPIPSTPSPVHAPRLGVPFRRQSAKASPVRRVLRRQRYASSIFTSPSCFSCCCCCCFFSLSRFLSV